jgi:hypothetical protein
MTANAQGKRRRSTEGAEGTNTGHENGEAMASVGVRLTDQLGDMALFHWWSAGGLYYGVSVACFAD